MWWITPRTPDPAQLKVLSNCPKYTVLGGVQRPPHLPVSAPDPPKSTIIPAQGDVFNSPGGLRGNEMPASLHGFSFGPYWSCDLINLWALPPYVGHDFSKVIKVQLRFDRGEYSAACPHWVSTLLRPNRDCCLHVLVLYSVSGKVQEYPHCFQVNTQTRSCRRRRGRRNILWKKYLYCDCLALNGPWNQNQPCEVLGELIQSAHIHSVLF